MRGWGPWIVAGAVVVGAALSFQLHALCSTRPRADFVEPARVLEPRQHDVIAVDLHDPLETDIADVGVLTLEDAETGELVWLDTSNPLWRNQFTQQTRNFEEAKNKVLANAGVDQIKIETDHDYIKALTIFFQKRAQRLRH